jgi:ribosomal protein S18 acetylase RimI-like enzyme
MTATAPNVELWTLREVRADDRRALDAVADLHMELLDYGPMAGLGRGFVRDICYEAHLNDKLLHVALASVEGEPAGFVAYTSLSIGFHRSGLRRHWFRAAVALARALVARPRRLLKLARALRVLWSRRGETVLGADPLGEVVCIAVRQQYLAPAFVRRAGVRLSEHLVRYAQQQLAASGVRRMRMIVDADNKPVLMLYHLMGAHFEPYEQAGEPRVHVWFDLDPVAPA